MDYCGRVPSSSAVNYYDSCEYAAACLPPAEFIQIYALRETSAPANSPARKITVTATGRSAHKRVAGRVSPKSRRISKRGEQRERRAVLTKLRAMVGGMPDDSTQLQIIEHVIQRIRELQEKLNADANAADFYNDDEMGGVGAPIRANVSPAESLLSLNSLNSATSSEHSPTAGRHTAGAEFDEDESSHDSDASISSSSSSSLSSLSDPTEIYSIQESVDSEDSSSSIQRLILQLSGVMSASRKRF